MSSKLLLHNLNLFGSNWLSLSFYNCFTLLGYKYDVTIQNTNNLIKKWIIGQFSQPVLLSLLVEYILCLTMLVQIQYQSQPTPRRYQVLPFLFLP